MKYLVAFLLIWVCFVGFSQEGIQDGDQNTSDDELIVYPIKKFVNNYYDSSIREKLYKKSLSTFEESKEIVIQKMASDKNMDVSDLKKTDYYPEIEASFSDPLEVNRRFKAYDVPALNVMGANFKNRDTSFLRVIYEQGKNQKDNKIKKTTIKWEVYDFKSIPTKKYPNYEVPQILDVQNIITDIKILKDGKYVMYYEPIYDNENQSFLIDKPFCFFEIKNYTTNGEAVFLTHLGDTIAKGNYLNGKQHGNWEIKLPYSKIPNSIDLDYWKIQVNGELLVGESKIEGSANKTGWCQYNLEYQEGILNGKFTFKIDNQVRSIGSIIDNKPIGNWKFYYNNGQLANSLNLLKKPVYLNENIIYPTTFNMQICDTANLVPYSPNIPPCFDLLPMGNSRSSFLGLTLDFYLSSQTPVTLEFGKNYIRQNNGYIKEEGDPYISDEYNYHENKDLVILYDRTSLERKLYTVGLFEAYHKNGQPYFSLEVNNNGEIIDFSEKIYDKDSNVIEEWYFNSKKNKAINILHYKDDRTIYKITRKNGKRIRKEKKHIPLSVFFRRRF